jgi:DNA-binding NarL/FixJ family response regulator
MSRSSRRWHLRAPHVGRPHAHQSRHRAVCRHRHEIGQSVQEVTRREFEGGPLTPRELEVLELLREGLTYAEIGERLGVTQRTARAHVVAVKEKLAAANNAQAVARGFERGLLRPLR